MREAVTSIFNDKRVIWAHILPRVGTLNLYFRVADVRFY